MAMKNPVHPGTIVKGCLADLELSVTDAAKILGGHASNRLETDQQ